ncbi:glycosyltransferase family 2 protein [Benzoatithermus flavus]|uniref:Glycosyltransferase family 2 protein n=1 Tax=Benzoatithermus flavus TaxID=3108223 RepID=A0ABU8XWB3_9PROT
MTRQPGSTDGPSIGVVVVTHAARRHLERCLPPLLRSPLRPRVLVVNSSSGDGTVELAEAMGAETFVVPRASFNHGLTRELARRRLGTAVVAMLTPDAYPVRDDFLERLTAPVRDGHAAVAYGRQIPREDAAPVERLGRIFNYPATSHVRSLTDWPQHGGYTHFCSNACAAWSNAALDAIGGFKATLVSEETIAAAELLARGHKIAYVAEAVVVHSHAQSLEDAFRRQFDIGYTRRLHADLLLARERDEVRGRQFATMALRKAAVAELPRVVAHLAVSWLGYRIGMAGPRLPQAVARRLSGQDYYWTSEPARNGARGLAVA